MSKIKWFIHKAYVCGCSITESEYHRHKYRNDKTQRIPFLVECKEHGGRTRMWYSDPLIPGDIWVPDNFKQDKDEEIAQLIGLA